MSNYAQSVLLREHHRYAILAATGKLSQRLSCIYTQTIIDEGQKSALKRGYHTTDLVLI